MRLADAEALIQVRRYSAAYYLAGYAVECALKACIAKQTRRYDFPPDPRSVARMYTHNLESLLDIAGLRADLDADAHSDPAFARNWVAVKDWSEQARYQVWTLSQAELLVEAIADDDHGVMRWLRQHW
jgi:hypothetical protein